MTSISSSSAARMAGLRWGLIVTVALWAGIGPARARSPGDASPEPRLPRAQSVSAAGPRRSQGRLTPACPGLSLGRPASVAGTVVGSDDAPLAGVVVSNLDTGARVITSPTGEFDLAGLTSGTVHLAVDQPELGRLLLEPTVFPGRNQLRIPLAIPDWGFVFGRVWDDCRGRPLAGARVELPQAEAVATDRNGLFVIPACCGTLSDIHVSAPGYRSIEIPFSGRVYRTSVWVEAHLSPLAAAPTTSAP